MNDILTMIWKESKDVIFQGGWRSLIRPLLMIAILGIYVPLQFGLQWVALTPIALIILLWVPFFVIISFIGDAIAGERERHTLETLLASRMPDQAVLLGKVITTVLFAWCMSLFSLLLGLLLVDLFSTQGNWLFYPLDLLAEAIFLSLLTNVLGASAGVLISLKVSTVRQAQQVLSIGTTVLIFGSILILRLLPANVFASLNYQQGVLVFIAVIALLDAILLGFSFFSFRRSRLILS